MAHIQIPVVLSLLLAESDVFFIPTEDGLSRAFYHPYGGFF